MKNVLVAGACGFIGHHLTQKLVDLGYEVYGCDDGSTATDENAKKIWDLLGYKKYFKGSALKVDARMVDAIFNCAAQPRMQWVKEHPEGTLDANVKVVAYLAKQAKAHNIPLIHCSSSSVYGISHELETGEDGIYESANCTPTNSYAFQKALAESIVQDIEPRAVMLRFFNIYGEGQDPDSPYTGVITRFLKAKREGKSLQIFGDGLQERDFTYVHDVVDAIIKSYDYIQKRTGVHVYNVASHNPFSVKAIADAISKDQEFLPPRQGDVQRTKGNIEKAKKDLGWEPSGMTPIKWVNL